VSSQKSSGRFKVRGEPITMKGGIVERQSPLFSSAGSHFLQERHLKSDGIGYNAAFGPPMPV
jgi:hypothetical protein